MWITNFFTKEWGLGYSIKVSFIISAIMAFVLSLFSFIFIPVIKKEESTVNKKKSLVQKLGLEAFVLFKQKKMALFFIFSMLLGGALQLTNAYGDAFLQDVNVFPKGTLVYNFSTIILSISQISETLFILAIPFFMDKIPYLSKANIELKANIDANLKDSKYTLKDNYTRINAIKFAVNGWVQVLKSGGYDMDLKLDTKEVDFKSILSLVPAIYAKEFNGVKASGNVNLSGFVKGKMEGENYPAFGLKMKVSNGTFQYPDLPKSVQGITINASVESPGGSLDKTVVDVSPFAFSLGGNPFSLKLHDGLREKGKCAVVPRKRRKARIRQVEPEYRRDFQITLFLSAAKRCFIR